MLHVKMPISWYQNENYEPTGKPLPPGKHGRWGQKYADNNLAWIKNNNIWDGTHAKEMGVTYGKDDVDLLAIYLERMN